MFSCFTHCRAAPAPKPPTIDGYPHWIQDEPRRYGTFLAAFESVSWVADPDPTQPAVKHLDFFDSALLNLCLADGHVTARFQCY